MSKPLVSSKNGLATKAAGSSMVLMGIVVILFCINAIVQNFQPIFIPALFGFMGIFMIALGIDEGFFSKVEVTSTHVRVKKWGSWEEYSLSQIDAVDVLRDWLGLGGLILVMVAKGRPSLQINLRQYENRKEVAQQILQVAHQQNKNILIMPRVQKRFGQPPYKK